MNFCIFIFCILSAMVKSEDCSEDRIQKISKWANSLPILVEQDAKRRKNLKNFDDLDHIDDLRDHYYKTVSETFQTKCSLLKKIGGQWKSSCGHLEDEKTMCMDNLHYKVQKKECLIYSFGINSHWDFEEFMANIGCRVHVFDPMVEVPDRIRNNSYITVDQIGIGKMSAMKKFKSGKKTTIEKPVITLQEAIEIYKDNENEITYLKLDIDGAEFEVLPQIVEAGLLDRIQQLSVTMNTGSPHLTKRQIVPKLNEILQTFKKMQENYGFHLLSSSTDGCKHKKFCLTKTYHNYHDLLFYKSKSA